MTLYKIRGSLAIGRRAYESRTRHNCIETTGRRRLEHIKRPAGQENILSIKDEYPSFEGAEIVLGMIWSQLHGVMPGSLQYYVQLEGGEWMKHSAYTVVLERANGGPPRVAQSPDLLASHLKNVGP